MKLVLAAAAAFAGLTACQSDETARAYGAADHLWTLTELNGAPFAAKATLSFPESGQIAGQAPCNRYSAPMSVPYPWFEARQITSTRMACPDLAAETAFFDALKVATLSEISGGTLILSNTDGLSMVFTASD